MGVDKVGRTRIRELKPHRPGRRGAPSEPGPPEGGLSVNWLLFEQLEPAISRAYRLRSRFCNQR